MKIRYWLFISILMGILIWYFGKSCLLLLMAITWCGGTIFYFLRFVYEQAYWQRRNRIFFFNDDTLKLYRKRMYFYEEWARILMYLGCIAVIEAVIIL